MDNIYFVGLVAIIDGEKQSLATKQINGDEDKAIAEYFKYDRKRNSIRDGLCKSTNKPVETYVEYNVINTKDSSLNTLEKYNFFSKIQSIKDKARLPFMD